MVTNIFLSAEQGNNQVMTWIFVGLLVVLVIALFVVPMFTNKKRAKQTTELHNSLKPGDVIKTVGGIIGTIKEIRQISPADKEMVIETGVGDNKTTMVFDIQALYQVVSRADTPVDGNVFEHSEEADGTQNEQTVAPVEHEEQVEHSSVTEEAETEVQAKVESESKPEDDAEKEQAASVEEKTVTESVENSETAAVESEKTSAAADETVASEEVKEPKKTSKPKSATSKAKSANAPKSNSATKNTAHKNSSKK